MWIELIEMDSCFVLRKSISGHIFVGEISSYTSTYVHILQIRSSTMPPKCNLEIVCVHICLNEFGFPFVFDSNFLQEYVALVKKDRHVGV